MMTTSEWNANSIFVIGVSYGTRIGHLIFAMDLTLSDGAGTIAFWERHLHRQLWGDWKPNSWGGFRLSKVLFSNPLIGGNWRGGGGSKPSYRILFNQILRSLLWHDTFCIAYTFVLLNFTIFHWMTKMKKTYIFSGAVCWVDRNAAYFVWRYYLLGQSCVLSSWSQKSSLLGTKQSDSCIGHVSMFQPKNSRMARHSQYDPHFSGTVNGSTSVQFPSQYLSSVDDNRSREYSGWNCNVPNTTRELFCAQWIWFLWSWRWNTASSKKILSSHKVGCVLVDSTNRSQKDTCLSPSSSFNGIS